MLKKREKRHIQHLIVGDILVNDDLWQFIDWNDKVRVTKIVGDIVEMVGVKDGIKYVSSLKAVLNAYIYAE